MKIALFGTSADPPTAAHQSILQWLSDHYDQVAVWASDNPFKENQTPLSHRMMMLELLIGEMSDNVQNIQVYEQLSDRRSLKSLEKAKAIWGEDAEYSLVIGSDLIEQICNWYHVQDLFKAVLLLIVPRPGYQIKTKNLKTLEEFGGKYQIADINAPKISSTTYRINKDKTVITPLVKKYIDQQKLYAP
jgi:nicotinate-nucleotide adenylyltransferase